MALLPSFPNMGPEDMPQLTPAEVREVVEAVEGAAYMKRHEDDPGPFPQPESTS